MNPMKLNSPRCGALAWPLAALLLALVFVTATLTGRAQETTESTSEVQGRAVTVVLVRHAEKGDDDPRNPSLSEAGTARAQELARVLAASGATHLYSTAYKRTRETLAPLAAARGLEVEDYDPRDPGGLIDILAALPAGSVAVVAGHSNTTPGLFRSLGGEAQGLVDSSYGKILPEHAYDRLFIASCSRADGADLRIHSAVELRYGEVCEDE
jgi:phosphohistidine phosphatase SixA